MYTYGRARATCDLEISARIPQFEWHAAATIRALLKIGIARCVYSIAMARKVSTRTAKQRTSARIKSETPPEVGLLLRSGVIALASAAGAFHGLPLTGKCHRCAANDPTILSSARDCWLPCISILSCYSSVKFCFCICCNMCQGFVL